MHVVTAYPHYPQWAVPPSGERRRLRSGDEGTRRVRHYVPAQPSGVRRLLAELSFGLRAATVSWRRPDVVVCVSPALFSSTVVALRARLARRRPALAMVVQDLYSRGVQETGTGASRLVSVMGLLEGRTMRLFDGVSVIHDRFRAKVVESFSLRPDRVTTIRNWTHVHAAPTFDTSAFRERMGWAADECVVLHAGAMGLKQDLGNVVEAARFADREQASVRFVLLGGGSQRASLEEQAEGVSSVQFLSSLDDDDFAKALAAADVLLVNERPGVADMAVPSKLTSYFVAGRPVVAATEPHSATAEEVRAAGAGVQVRPGDPAALLRAVRDVHATDASVMAAAGRSYAQTVLSAAAAAEAYDEWVRDLARRPRRDADADRRTAH